MLLRKETQVGRTETSASWFELGGVFHLQQAIEKKACCDICVSCFCCRIILAVSE